MSGKIESLEGIEVEILNLGSQLAFLFQKIEGIYNRENYREKKEGIFNLKEILDKITKIKADLHTKVDEIYNQRSFPYSNKIHFDIEEKTKELLKLENYITNLLPK